MAKNRKYPDVYAASERKHMYALQRWKDRLLSPLLYIFMKMHITPNMLSYCNVILGIFFLLFIQTDVMISLIMLIIAMSFDMLDGSLARASKNLTMSGSLVDHFSDLLVIVLTTIGFLLINLVSGWAAVAYAFSYTSLTTFIIVRNMMGIPYKWALRPRLLVYLCFLIYAIWQINFIGYALIFFSAVMTIQAVLGFFRVKKVI